MSDEDDFGGGDEEDIVDRDLKPDNLIQFPRMRPNEKISEKWAAAVIKANRRLEKRYSFPSPLEAALELARKRTQPTMPWPAQWTELAKRCRVYAGECVGVVGPTGGGKTSFALQTAIAARAARTPVLWSPLELDPPEVGLRIVANMTATHTARIRDEWSDARIREHLTALEDFWRFVPRESDPTKQIDAYRAAIHLAKEVFQAQPLLVVDYIGKLARGSRDPRLAISNEAENLRELAVSEECYVMILAQPSRSNNAVLTGKNEIESATDAIGVAGESSEIEHACSVLIGLNVFKADDTEELDAHVLVTKARGTGREGRQGFKFKKPGGVWEEQPLLPPTPSQVSAKLKQEKKNKSRIEPATKENVQTDLRMEARSTADLERQRRVRGALQRAGLIGMTFNELRRTPGTGLGEVLQQTLQELERAGDIERLIGAGKWRIVFR